MDVAFILLCFGLMVLAAAGIPVRAPWATACHVIVTFLFLLAALFAVGIVSG